MQAHRSILHMHLFTEKTMPFSYALSHVVSFNMDTQVKLDLQPFVRVGAGSLVGIWSCRCLRNISLSRQSLWGRTVRFDNKKMQGTHRFAPYVYLVMLQKEKWVKF